MNSSSRDHATSTDSALEDFHTGQLVRLRSGGPTMTVREVFEGEVYTFWFPHDIPTDMPSHYPWPPECLEHVAWARLLEGAPLARHQVVARGYYALKYGGATIEVSP